MCFPNNRFLHHWRFKEFSIMREILLILIQCITFTNCLSYFSRRIHWMAIQILKNLTIILPCPHFQVLDFNFHNFFFHKLWKKFKIIGFIQYLKCKRGGGTQKSQDGGYDCITEIPSLFYTYICTRHVNNKQGKDQIVAVNILNFLTHTQSTGTCLQHIWHGPG